MEKSQILEQLVHTELKHKNNIKKIDDPIYKYEQTVSFKIDGEIKTGKVYIIDRYGTWEMTDENREPSYDVMVEDGPDSQPCLYKHIPQSLIIKNDEKKIQTVKYYDPEYDRIVDESEVKRQWNYFKEHSKTFNQTFEKFAEENFVKCEEENPSVDKYTIHEDWYQEKSR